MREKFYNGENIFLDCGKFHKKFWNAKMFGGKFWEGKGSSWKCIENSGMVLKFPECLKTSGKISWTCKNVRENFETVGKFPERARKILGCWEKILEIQNWQEKISKYISKFIQRCRKISRESKNVKKLSWQYKNIGKKIQNAWKYCRERGKSREKFWCAEINVGKFWEGEKICKDQKMTGIQFGMVGKFPKSASKILRCR